MEGVSLNRQVLHMGADGGHFHTASAESRRSLRSAWPAALNTSAAGRCRAFRHTKRTLVCVSLTAPLDQLVPACRHSPIRSVLRLACHTPAAPWQYPRQRVADIHHHRQADDFGAGPEVSEGAALGHFRKLRDGRAHLNIHPSDSASSKAARPDCGAVQQK
jgi:hypothetical protein